MRGPQTAPLGNVRLQTLHLSSGSHEVPGSFATGMQSPDLHMPFVHGFPSPRSHDVPFWASSCVHCIPSQRSTVHGWPSSHVNTPPVTQTSNVLARKSST